MPGILPMKMIRVGSNNTSRIAQACDRCRSKKIRCDGVRPCCSQCANVGFECKTSDKLSRRAFPRGYTESLEDRVRGLEAEVRELKDLLDEKDEKIDMLSRIHNFSRKGSISMSPASTTQVKAEALSTQEDVLHVEVPVPVNNSTGMGGSSTTSALIEAFENKVHESGRPCAAIPVATLTTPATPTVKSPGPSANTSVAPPRLLSDQYINLFFQEWQPLLPILHRQTFLRLYEQYLAEPDGKSLSANKIAVTQLFLIFEIAAHSQSSRTKPNTAAYEGQWRKALSLVSSTPSLESLQCHVLAQLCYLLKADHNRMLRHRAYAVSICQQLGLHKRYNGHNLPRFEAEARKKVFWCAYVLDKFTAITTGMPTLLRDSDISTEYPTDIDDENITEQGISPTLPGELTKISSALALFRMSRILAKTYEHLYPASPSYSLSLTKLHSLSDELDQWHEELPDHLRLRFCNDKPATHLTSDRSPLLSLAYFYTRSLVHRPILCHGSGSAASAATIVVAAAAKHIVQILDLLDERCMNYTFPVNKQDVLINAAFSMLWQCMDLEEDSRLIKDNQKSLTLLLTKASRENNIAGTELRNVASCFVTLGRSEAPPSKRIEINTPAARLLSCMPTSTSSKQKSTRKQLHAVISHFSNTNQRTKHEESHTPRVIAPLPSSHGTGSQRRANSTVSLTSIKSAPNGQAATLSPRLASSSSRPNPTSATVNLDYFPLDDGSMQPPRKQRIEPSPNASWENLFSEVDAYNTIAPHALSKTISNPESNTVDWSHAEDIWHSGGYHHVASKTNVPQSLLSFSEESLTSGDDLLFSAPGSHNGSLSTSDGLEVHGDEAFKGIAMPVSSIEDDIDFSPRAHA